MIDHMPSNYMLSKYDTMCNQAFKNSLIEVEVISMPALDTVKASSTLLSYCVMIDWQISTFLNIVTAILLVTFEFC